MPRTPSRPNARPVRQRGHFVSGSTTTVRSRGAATAGPRHGLARVLSKAGICSRSEAARWIVEGRVRVAGRLIRDPEFPIASPAPVIEVDGQPLAPPQRVYLMLNKPRGLVTTVQDERGRDTVYRCFDGAQLPWLAPVGRLDKASEGLLLFSNDPEWAAQLTDPASGPLKTYRVQVDGLPDPEQLARMQTGIEDAGEHLSVHSVIVLRHGERTAWLEIVLDEGRNRHIRRLLLVLGLQVLRLVRIAIGSLQLAELGKGEWRLLTQSELRSLSGRGAGSSANSEKYSK